MLQDLQALRILISKRKGGPGSGHHGHAGRPGQVGGSTPGTGGVGVLAHVRSEKDKQYFSHGTVNDVLVNPDSYEEVREEIGTPKVTGTTKAIYHIPTGTLAFDIDTSRADSHLSMIARLAGVEWWKGADMPGDIGYWASSANENSVRFHVKWSSQGKGAKELIFDDSFAGVDIWGDRGVIDAFDNVYVAMGRISDIGFPNIPVNIRTSRTRRTMTTTLKEFVLAFKVALKGGPKDQGSGHFDLPGNKHR